MAKYLLLWHVLVKDKFPTWDVSVIESETDDLHSAIFADWRNQEQAYDGELILQQVLKL